MKGNREYIATFGLLAITVMSALQFIFLQNVPSSVSTFSFLCLTNAVGLVILAVMQGKKIKLINRKLLLKGILLSAELVGFNFFMILGSRGMDSVVSSSLVSMYFIFVTPMLILLKKKVSFRSAVASVVAVIALILMFNADMGLLFSSYNVFYMIIADIFFAAYVISISLVGEKEDSSVLTMSQMLFAFIFAFCGWGIEIGMGSSSFTLPTDRKFWFTVLFMGIFIRAIYGLVQITCQKYVKPVNASLLFSSEIIITLITNPFLSKLMGTSYTPTTKYQIIGCFLFVIAVLVVDDTMMGYIGYTDMDTKTYIDEKGVERTQSTVSRKFTNVTLVISMAALIISTVICISAISSIKNTAVDKSTSLGHSAADVSEAALKEELERELTNTVSDKSSLAEAKLTAYISSAKFAVDYAAALYDNPDNYGDKEVMYPLAKNTGKWAMQRCLADENLPYSEVEAENKLLGNMEEVLAPIVEHNENISTIYMGTQNGLLISYDPNSGDTDVGVENYYEFREATWYKEAQQADGPFFTNAYQDGYGRGLTITCAAPIRDGSGEFRGCIGIDVLVNDLNETMVNDHIVNPNYATLLDKEGYIIASKEVDSQSSGTITIFDDGVNTPITEVADTVLTGVEGICQVGKGDDSIYISYAKIPLTSWTLCIMSPVKNIIKPAVSIREDITTNTQDVAKTVNDSIRQIINSVLVLFATIILIITFFVGKTSAKITKPLQHLEKDVLKISDGHFDQRTYVSTDDEIGSLARAFNSMTESLQNYIVNLKDMTAKEQRIASELSVATQIQASILPSDFPAFPERDEFDIYASMTPAKEVGGDFYDFFLIDDDHLALVIADVSGKGVPAALFMMNSKSLLKNQALMGYGPKEILMTVNNQLCENNEAEMFVTVWLGILEISTGKLVAANAGHEYPAIKRANGKYELYMDKHGLVLGGMENVKYREYELELNKGDTLFVYTDGVAEATDSNNQLYGTDRMITALNKTPDARPEQMISNMLDDINLFVGEAEQFDDITMLALKLND